jgi:hypothetical protein
VNQLYFWYDPHVFDGDEPTALRVVKRAGDEITHFFEKKVSSGKIRSYIYALGKHLTRVDSMELAMLIHGFSVRIH